MPFELPQGWVWTTLGEVCKFENGYAFKSDEYKCEGIPLVRISNIVDNTIDLKGCVFISKKIDHIYIVRKGDLLIALSGATTGKMGVYDLDKVAYLNQRVGNLRVINISVLSPAYRNLFMYSKADEILKLAYGGAQPNISGSVICSLSFPLPPLTEQTRIVDEVEHWFKLIDTIEQGKADLQTAIKQAKGKILELAINGKLVPQDPTDEPASELLKRINPKAHITCDNEHNRKLPDGWSVLKVKDAFIINPRNKLDDNTDVGFIPMTYINDGYSGEFKYESKKWTEIKNGFTHFSDGDIAVAKISPCLENLKSMILEDLPNGVGAGTTELYVFRALYTSSKYSLYFFKSSVFIWKCVGTFNGVVGQQRVGKSIIEDILFPIPPRAEQERIVAKIEELFSCLDEIQKSLEA